MADLNPLQPESPPQLMEQTIHHESARKKRSRDRKTQSLNITSMIDVIFLLLIYFVVTANFTVDEGVLTVKMPQGSGQPTQTDLKPPEEPMNIILTSVGLNDVDITIGGARRASSFSQLYELLVSLQNDPKRSRQGVYAPDNPVIIKPDGQVRWQHVVNAFNAAVHARYSNVAFSSGQ